MLQCVDRRGLFRGVSGENKLDMGMAIIGRKVDFGDSGGADPRVGKLVADQFFKLFADRFRDSFVAVRVQTSGYPPCVRETTQAVIVSKWIASHDTPKSLSIFCSYEWSLNCNITAAVANHRQARKEFSHAFSTGSRNRSGL
jgi:hypothetical protein